MSVTKKLKINNACKGGLFFLIDNKLMKVADIYEGKSCKVEDNMFVATETNQKQLILTNSTIESNRYAKQFILLQNIKHEIKQREIDIANLEKDRIKRLDAMLKDNLCDYDKGALELGNIMMLILQHKQKIKAILERQQISYQYQENIKTITLQLEACCLTKVNWLKYPIVWFPLVELVSNQKSIDLINIFERKEMKIAVEKFPSEIYTKDNECKEFGIEIDDCLDLANFYGLLPLLSNWQNICTWIAFNYQSNFNIIKYFGDDFSVGDSATFALSHLLSKNKLLEEFDMCANELTNMTAIYVMNSINECTSLTSITLSENFIGNQGAMSIASMLRQQQNIITLNIRNNEIQDSGISAIVAALNNKTRFKNLDLANNYVGDPGADNIGKYLNDNTSIEWIDISDNDITPIGLNLIAKSLAHNRTLKTFTVGECNIGSESIYYLSIFREAAQVEDMDFSLEWVLKNNNA